jgi:hypothetical protein
VSLVRVPNAVRRRAYDVAQGRDFFMGLDVELTLDPQTKGKARLEEQAPRVPSHPGGSLSRREQAD